MKSYLPTCFALSLAVMMQGQSVPFFFNQVQITEIQLPERAETISLPAHYTAYKLDLEAMKNYLRIAPAEGSQAAISSPFLLQLPLPDGIIETFRVWESPVMHPDLAVKFPMIKTYAGQGIENPAHNLRLGYGLDGFHAVINGDGGGAGIVPYANQQTEYYVCASIPDLVKAEDILPPHCNGEHENAVPGPALDVTSQGAPIQLRGGGEGGPVQLKVYQYALACTGEFASLHGGTVAGVMSAFVTSTNIVNSVMEPENALRLILVPNNDQLIFLDPASDPYNQFPYSDALFDQNESFLNQKIGFYAYDIGHLFVAYPCRINNGGTVVGIGGQADGLFCTESKARGYSCHSDNNIIGFSYRVAVHELAHQLTADHSFSNCPGTYAFAVASGNAYEPGSGSTIMSYQGACPNNNVPAPGGNYFHGSNIEQIWEYTHLFAGNACPTLKETSNHAPDVTMPYENGFYIPISTPYELYVEATDEDGDAITYCWEQMNIGPQSELGFPVGNSPSFRSFEPVSSPVRIFPRLPVLLENGSESTEVLPTYSRNLKFRCTVRDNNVSEGAGGVTWKDVSFNATASAGPFLVTFPNEAVVWKAGQEVEITWDVANTDNDVVKCRTVNIKLSADGGLTYPYTLMAFTQNDGYEKVYIPDVVTDKARIRVEAANNIFFDISNKNFSIQAAEKPGFIMSSHPQWQQTCVPASQIAVELKTSPILGFDAPVELEITGGLPAGTGISFSKNPVFPGENTQLFLKMDNVTSDGLFEATLRAVAGTDTIYQSLYFDVIYSDFSAFKLETPLDGQSKLGLLPTFTWTDLPQADAYDFQLSISPAFEQGTIIDQVSGLENASYTPDTVLVENQVYFWRVRSSNECGAVPYSLTRAFQTFTISCVPHVSTDVPQNIPSLGLPVIKSVIPIFENGVISDLNIGQIKGTHDALADLEVKLISPAGTEVVLFSQPPCFVSAFNFGLNDESPFAIGCPPLNGKVYKPKEPLSTFVGESTLGNWTLQVAVKDPQGNGGVLQNWNLNFCASVTPNHPFLVKNDTIYVKPLATRLIHNFELAVEDTDNPGNQLQFTIVKIPENGYLSRDGETLNIGGHFTMTDIHLQKITYTNTDPGAVYDFFTFIVEDGTGGWLGTPRMNIIVDENAVTPVSEKEFDAFFLFPNPARNELTVSFKEMPQSEGMIHISDANGRLVFQQKTGPLQQQAHLKLDGFAEGLYFLTVRTEGRVWVEKLVVLP